MKIKTISLILIICCFCGVKEARSQEIDVAKIAFLESSGNPFAYNKRHYGLCQIGEAVLKDYNKKHKTIWTTQDLYNGVLNLRIARWYLNIEIPRLLRHFKCADTLENRITAHRLGIQAVREGKRADAYIRAYKRQTK